MVRREFVVVSVLLACALNVAQCSSENGKTRMKVISISNMTQFLSENPGVQLTPLASKIVNTTPYIQRVYPFGARVLGKSWTNLVDLFLYEFERNYTILFLHFEILGDRILATDHAQQQWGTPQDVTKNLYYPAQGIGAVITYLEIIVDQVNATISNDIIFN